jgi:acyl carrier protein
MHGRPNLSNTCVAPRNDTEMKLVEIWQELLGIDPIGVNDNFFDLGGDSVLAIQVASRLRRALRIDIPVRTLFEAPTVEGLGKVVAMLLRAQDATGESSAGPFEEFTL